MQTVWGGARCDALRVGRRRGFAVPPVPSLQYPLQMLSQAQGCTCQMRPKPAEMLSDRPSPLPNFRGAYLPNAWGHPTSALLWGPSDKALGRCPGFIAGIFYSWSCISQTQRSFSA